jgi:hypothetical protein
VIAAISGMAAPDPVTRTGAQDAARLELSKRAYHHDDPTLAERVLKWIADRLGKLLDAAPRHAPGHGVGLVLIIVFVAVVVAVVATRVGRLRRSPRADEPLLGDERLTAAVHRRRAEQFANEAKWAEAIRERLRAITRELEERGVLDPRPGRTADELCVEAAAQLPAVASDLRRAATIFDDVWYGGRTASRADEQVLHALDDRVAGSHRALVTQS